MDKPYKFLSENIPPYFYEFTTGLPFEKCTFCDNLLSNHTRYAIEKVFKQNRVLQSKEIVYEYAMCWGCIGSMGSDISDDSRKAIMAVFQDHKEHIRLKSEFLHENEMYTIDSWTERCSLTGKEIRLCDEFAVSAIIEDGCLVYDHSPMVVSDEFMEKLQSVMSKETKEHFDGLRDEILDGSPSVEDLIFSPTPGLV